MVIPASVVESVQSLLINIVAVLVFCMTVSLFFLGGKPVGMFVRSCVIEL